MITRPIQIATVVLALAVGAAGTAAGQETSLVIVSDPDDFVGGGQTYTETPATGSFSASHLDGLVEVRFQDPGNLLNRWTLTFSAPIGFPLVPGSYDQAGAFRTALFPGLVISGQGHGCSSVQGSFVVREFVAGAGSSVQSFRATFEQHCDGQAAALRGEIRYNVLVPIDVSAPLVVVTTAGQLVSFEVTANSSGGGPVVIEAEGLPAGAQFIDLGDGTGQFTWQTPSDLSGQYGVTFAATNLAEETETAQTQIRVSPLNDALSAAQILPGPDGLSLIGGTTLSATAEPGEPEHGWSEPRSVWFKWVAPSADRIVLETVGASFPTVIAVYTDRTPLTPPSLLDLQWTAVGQPPWDTNGAKAVFSVEAGVTYYVAIDGHEGGSGTFSLRMRRGELTKALWRHTTGAISLWSVDSSGHIVSSPQYGPFPGWEALRIGVGPDRTTRVLWRHVAGHVSLWHLDSDGNLVGSLVFGPYAGWAVSDLAIDSGGGIHLSWLHSSGALGLWFMAPSGAIDSALVFGPYPGWQAIALAAGPVRHTLWRDSANTTGLWKEYYSYGVPYVSVDGPGPAWTPVDVAPYVHDQAWILSRTNTGVAKAWRLANNPFSYGPFPGWQAIAVAAPNVEQADHGARILWRTDDGRASIWHTDVSGQGARAFGYGPFPGWTVIDIAAGPD